MLGLTGKSKNHKIFNPNSEAAVRLNKQTKNPPFPIPQKYANLSYFKKCGQFAKYTNQIIIIVVLLENKFLVYIVEILRFFKKKIPKRMFVILHYKLWAKSLIILCKHLETTQSYSNIFVKNQDPTRPLWNSNFFLNAQFKMHYYYWNPTYCLFSYCSDAQTTETRRQNT